MKNIIGQFSIKQKILAGFALILLILTAVSLSGIQSLSATKTSVVTVVDEVQPTVVTSMELATALERSAQSLGFYLLTLEERDKQAYLDNLAKVDSVLETLKAQKPVQSDPDVQILLAKIEQGISKYKGYQTQMLKYASSPAENMPAVASSSDLLNPRARNMLQYISQMLDAEVEGNTYVTPAMIKKDLYELRYALSNMLSELRAFMFSRAPAVVENMNLYKERVANLTNKIKGYGDGLGFEAGDAIKQFDTAFQEYNTHLDSIVNMHASDKWRTDAFVLRNELGPLLNSVKTDLVDLVSNQRGKVEADSTELMDTVGNAQNFVMILFVIGLLVGMGSAYVIGRIITNPLNEAVMAMNDIAEGEGDLTRRLNVRGKDEIAQLGLAFNKFASKVHGLVSEVMRSTTQLASAASELSMVTMQTNEGVGKQQSETEQVATAINEMTATVQEVAGHAAQAASAANEANEYSMNGKNVVTRGIQSIGALATEIAEAGEVIHRLESESVSIGTVLDVIRGIAEQTNLLALNAAIEAARAGEQGRGFAVVADEVRTLASRTQESTQEIQSMIERLQSGAHDAVDVMKRSQTRATDTVTQATEAGEALNAITAAVTRINDMNMQIASAAEEQSAVTEEINQNVVRITDIAHETANSAQQIADSSEELARLSEELDRLVGQFRV